MSSHGTVMKCYINQETSTSFATRKDNVAANVNVVCKPLSMEVNSSILLSNVTVLTQFLSIFFTVNNFATIILVYENSTSNLASSILEGTTAPLKWATINIDVHYIYPPPPNGPYQIFFTDDEDFKRHDHEMIFKDPESFIISVFDQDRPADKLLFTRKRFPLNERCSNFIILPTADDRAMTQSYIKSLMTAVASLRLVNVAGIIWKQDSFSVDLLRLRYDTGEVVPIATNDPSTVMAQAFYDKTLDMQGREIVVFILFEPLRIINLTSSLEQYQQQVNVGGRDGFFCAILDELLHTKSTFFTWDISEYTEQLTNSATLRFFEDFFRRSYIEDDLQPNHIEYAIVMRDSKEE